MTALEKLIKTVGIDKIAEALGVKVGDVFRVVSNVDKDSVLFRNEEFMLTKNGLLSRCYYEGFRSEWIPSVMLSVMIDHVGLTHDIVKEVE